MSSSRVWSPDIGGQPLALAVRLGETALLSAVPVGTVPSNLVAWPDASWQSVDTAVATITPVAGSPNQATVTPVALGTTVISATIAGRVQVFTIDVVAASPQAVMVIRGLQPGPIPWPST